MRRRTPQILKNVFRLSSLRPGRQAVIDAALGVRRERRGAQYELKPRLFTDSVESLAAGYDKRRQRDHARLEQMVIYAQTALRRTALLVDAFGEPRI